MISEIAQHIIATDELVNKYTNIRNGDRVEVEVRIYKLKLDNMDKLIYFDLKDLPAGTFNYIQKQKHAVMFGLMHSNSNSSAPIITDIIGEIRKIIYEKMQHLIKLPKPKEHSRYNLRFYAPNDDHIEKIIYYQNKQYNVSMTAMLDIIRYCPISLNIYLKDMIVGSDDFTINLNIMRLDILDIPKKPETNRLYTLFNQTRLQNIKQYSALDSININKKYVSKKQIHQNIIKLMKDK